MANENDIYEMEYFDLSEDKKRRKKKNDNIYCSYVCLCCAWEAVW